MVRHPILVTVLTSGLALTGCTEEPTHMNRGLSSWVYDLDSDDAFKRSNACEAIAAIGPAAHETIPRLVKLLEDPHGSVAPLCELALAKIGEKSIPALEEVAARPEPELRLHGAAALVAIHPGHPKGTQVLAQTATGIGNVELAKQAQDIMVKMGAGAVPLLVPFLSDPYAPVRRAVMKTLGRIGAPAAGALPAVKKQLDDKDTDQRVAAVQTIAAIAPKAKAEPILRALLKDPTERVADMAGVMLQAIGARESASGNEDAPEEAPPKK